MSCLSNYYSLVHSNLRIMDLFDVKNNLFNSTDCSTVNCFLDNLYLMSCLSNYHSLVHSNLRIMDLFDVKSFDFRGIYILFLNFRIKKYIN